MKSLDYSLPNQLQSSESLPRGALDILLACARSPLKWVTYQLPLNPFLPLKNPQPRKTPTPAGVQGTIASEAQKSFRLNRRQNKARSEHGKVRL